MTHSMRAADIMTPNVATVTDTTAIEAAIRVMLDKHVSGLPVLDGTGALVGIVTEGDLLRRVELGTAPSHGHWLEILFGLSRRANDYVETNCRVVGDVMTREVRTVDADAPLAEIVAIIRDKHVKRVPVLSNGRMTGIVSRSDLMRTLADALAGSTAHADGPFRDADIHGAVVAAFKRQPWAPGGITVTVADGVVDLEGVLFKEADRAALRVAAENVAGVKSVRDHLIWVEPNSGMTYAPP